MNEETKEKGKKVFNVDDKDLAMLCATPVIIGAMVILALKGGDGGAIAGIVGTATTFYGSLATGRKKPEE